MPMEDVISKYKKQRKIKTIGIIVTSFLLAISLNAYLSTSDVWQSLKSSVIESTSWVKNTSDLYLDINNNIVSIKASKEMQNIKSLSFSLIYNWESLDLKDKLKSNYDFEIIELNNSKWQYTVSLNSKTNTSVKAWDNILSLVFEKKWDETQNINLIQANFVDKDDNSFNLSTSWVQY